MTPEQHAAKFADFDAANPHVYARIVHIARKMFDTGRRKFWGIAAIYERLRWESVFETTRDEDEFKLNNNYRAFYTRKMFHDFPDMVGFFRTRRSVADAVYPCAEPS